MEEPTTQPPPILCDGSTNTYQVTLSLTVNEEEQLCSELNTVSVLFTCTLKHTTVKVLSALALMYKRCATSNCFIMHKNYL